jgi:beta-lactamase class A
VGESILSGAPQCSSREAPSSERRRATRGRTIFQALGLALLTTAVTASSWHAWLADHASGTHSGHTSPAVQASEALTIDPESEWAPFATQQLPADPLFQRYYANDAGATALGPALTPAIPASGGWIQVFRSGALFAPGRPWTPHLRQIAMGAGLPDAAITALDPAAGVLDATTGIVRLPLFQTLLAVGSQAPIGGPGSSLTYADLLRASQPDRLVPAPAWFKQGPSQRQVGTFVAEGRRGGTIVGHLIPAAFWNAPAWSQLTPDGWQINLGRPLTEALHVRVSRDGQMHTLTVQVFEQAGLVLDTTAASSQLSAAPTLEPFSVGLDYLKTFGPPAATLAPGTSLWAQRDLTIRQAPDPNSATAATEETGLPLTATGQVQWAGGSLWYEVSWDAPDDQGSGWVSASDTSFRFVASSSPAPILSAQGTSTDPLGSWADLTAYVASMGGTAGFAVYDVTRGSSYGHNQQMPFIMGSSSKIVIMLTLLSETEAQGREPNGNEMSLLTTMIENSDNHAAQALFDEEGGAPAMAAFLRRAGVVGIQPNPNGWGYSTTTPRAMAHLLTLLYRRQVLSAHDRALALSLMKRIESDQRIGVGTTAPAGATVALKDGWVPGPDGLWVFNSSGIVFASHDTYIIAVYTHDDSSLGTGWAIAERIAGSVAHLLA